MTEIPIYGATTSGTQDPYFYLRVLFASTRGSLMELGIQPIVTAGMVIQLLHGLEDPFPQSVGENRVPLMA
jgi:protein transport protein SEC61 subunit alpha